MKLLLCAIALFCTSILFAQKIEVTNKGVTVNGKAVKANMTATDVIKLFGNPEKKQTQQGDLEYVYFSKGFSVFMDASTKLISCISVIFLPEEETSKAFAGKVIVAGVEVNAKMYRDIVYKIPDLKIKYKGEEGDDTVIGDVAVSFTYNNKVKLCRRVNVYLKIEEEG